MKLVFEQAQKSSLRDALLSDVCIGTSAAPTYLPAHFFRVTGKGTDGKVRKQEYNLIDGGVAANNPVRTLSFFLESLEYSSKSVVAWACRRWLPCR
jgi:patatin-like phospholipase/acyl hydrolase